MEKYLTTFYAHNSPLAQPIPPEGIAEYARTYSMPAQLTPGFGLYRTLPDDEAFNAGLEAPIDAPVLLLAQGAFPGSFEVESGCLDGLLAAPPQGGAINGSGHWLLEEAYAEVEARILPFISPASSS